MAEIAIMSPTSIRFVKHSFSADSDHHGALSNIADAALEPFIKTPEGREGALAFTKKHQFVLARFARSGPYRPRRRLASPIPGEAFRVRYGFQGA